MKQCELCGTDYDPVVKTNPPCPECFNIACFYPGVYKWVEKVADFTTRVARYQAGEDLYKHDKHNKHDRKPHYTNP